MGKQSKVKKAKQVNKIISANRPKTMDPVLIKAFVSGRESGIKEGKVDGIAEIIMKYDLWTEEMDQHIKGVGPVTKQAIREYFAERIRETIEQNKQRRQ
jgi:hypothetical protein